MTVRHALAGVRVVELGGGVAGAYCGRLLADCGATVTRFEPAGGDPLRARREDLASPQTEGLLFSWLNAGKSSVRSSGSRDLTSACAGADIVVVGEESPFETGSLQAGSVVVDLSWFAKSGPVAGWTGSDMIVQALTGMMHIAGPEEGPPMFMGDCQATFIGGLTAYIAAMAGLMAPARQEARRFDVSILEANIALSELQLTYAQATGEPSGRSGINRFRPNSPIGIYPCKDGWLGITALTPAQWQSLCEMLDLAEFAADPHFETGEGRHEQVDRLEHAIAAALRALSADEWAEEGRRRRVPCVVVPDARGILEHPIFAERESLASCRRNGRRIRMPRTPFAMSKTPTRSDLDTEEVPSARQQEHLRFALHRAASQAPLAGLRVADFSMGWAGPLATRIMADLGAEIIKIEAGRYPDWWRAVDWAPEAIQVKQFEQALPFAALNRGKKGVSLDLTTERGRALALKLIAKSDAVVENQAANVMNKLGLGYEDVRLARPDVVMMSMSAFGIGNPWSETRAYGSTLEQGSGLPSFAGRPDDPPTMAHLAYGDAVGGLYGCASLLTALIHRRRTGEGQLINLSMVECMLQFTAPALLSYQATGNDPERRGNRHAALSPHGCFAARGSDRWVAVAVTSDTAFEGLARLLGHEDWIGGPRLTWLDGRRRHADEIEQALASWIAERDFREAAATLQANGIAAAPVLRVEDIAHDAHLNEVGFFCEIDRPISGRQRQCGLAFTEQGRRFFAPTPAPLLGGDTQAVLISHAGVARAEYLMLTEKGVVTTSPTAFRAGAEPSTASEARSAAE